MAHIVYILRSKEGHIYVGMTNDLDRRLREHNSGQSNYTRKGTGWDLVYKEEVPTREEARRREKYFKSHAGTEWLQRRGIILL